ncbi:MAG: peptidoglycan DD-metalloendopeptidase family protein [Candidatus Acidiferrales bacterium]
MQIFGWTLIVVLAAAVIARSYSQRNAVEQELARQIHLAHAEAARIQSEVTLFSSRAIPRGLPFTNVLQNLGVDSSTTSKLIASTARVFDLRRVRAGNELAIGRSVLGELRAVRYQIDSDRMLWIAPWGDRFHAEIQNIPSTTGAEGVAGQIQGSLWESILDAGERPELAMRLADIFGYDMDFYTDTRPGDTFRVLVEKKHFATGSPVTYGHILAAEYNNRGRLYRAILFHDAAGREAYYTPDGKSLKRAFLHSPLKFAAPVTSHFSKSRFHPILKTYRPHLGTDYAAPTGTPVQTIGDGKVIFAGRKGGAGNLIQIQHTNGYETYYMHLSRVLVRSGQRVEQGQRIGLVGMTGLATGPHLDFRIQRQGLFLNFERLNLPSSEPIAVRDKVEFAATRDRALGLLPDLNEILAHNLRHDSNPTP